MTEAEFLEQEEARNQIGVEESIFAVTPTAVNGEDDDTTLSDPEEDEDLPHGEGDNDPSSTIRAQDKDATDDEVDYEEGIDKGFRAVRVRKQGRDFDGVMAAIKQMEDKSECHVMMQSLIEQLWALPRKND